MTIWVGFGSAVLAGLIGLAGVALGSLIAADQAQKAIVADRELAVREDLIDAAGEFTAAIDAQRAAGLDWSECWSTIGTGAADCDTEELAYIGAWLDMSAAFTKVTYFAPATVADAASDLAGWMPDPVHMRGLVRSGEDVDAARNEPYYRLSGAFTEALCLTVNPYSNACGDGEAAESTGQ